MASVISLGRATTTTRGYDYMKKKYQGWVHKISSICYKIEEIVVITIVMLLENLFNNNQGLTQTSVSVYSGLKNSGAKSYTERIQW